MLKIVTFATPNYKHVYERHIKTSISKIRMSKFHSHYTTDRLFNKCWVTRTNLKPGVILTELEKGNTVLYIDADAEIKSGAILAIDAIVPPCCIAACYFLDWDAWTGGCYGIIEPLTGTMFFRTEAIPLVKQWKEMANNSFEPDGKTWAKVIEGRRDIYSLPIEYCYINSLPNGNKGNIPCDNPLIVHYQESRNARI